MSSSGYNSFAVAPSLSPNFPDFPRTWECPITGIVVPKVPAENLQWRAKLLRAAEKDRGLQQELYTASRLSVLFWINAFCYTYRVFQGGTRDDGRVVQSTNQHVPFVTWPIQDEHILELEKAINEAYSLLTDKSRDMGASWTHAAVFDHQYRFRPDSLFLELSQKEEGVDDPGNPKALFVKHDYIYKWLPEWMRERRKRKYMSIANLDNDSRIDGESSNAVAGSGDRRRAVLLDEFAKVNNASKIKSAMRDVSPCLLPNSTPWGAGTEYTKWRYSGQIKVFVLPWWEHPEKGKDRFVDECPETHKSVIRSPWFDHECAIRTPKEIAQELNLDHIGSGDTFFEAMPVEQHKLMFGRPPTMATTLDFRKGTATDAIPGIIARRDHKKVRTYRVNHAELKVAAKWKFWPKLINGRLDQTKNYVLGIDVSKGQGASNSVISVLCAETREKVGELACANTPPYDLARIAVAGAVWIGGKRLPLMIWEAQGPGWDFGRQVVKTYRYPNYYIDRMARTVAEKRGKRYGWHSSREKKEIVLGMYRRALAHGGFINHSVEALDECLTYVYYENGGIGPAELRAESNQARKVHGDRVIGDMLCLLGVEEAPKPQTVKPQAPSKSPAARRKILEQKRKASRQGKTFDFSRS